MSNQLDFVLPFFGDDGRGKTYVSVNYRGDDFTKSAGDPRVDAHLLGVMLSDNYVNVYERGCVHPEFTDFIIRTALVHRSIDKPTGLGKLDSDTDELVNKLVSRITETKTQNFGSSANGQFFGDLDRLNRNLTAFLTSNKDLSYLISRLALLALPDNGIQIEPIAGAIVGSDGFGYNYKTVTDIVRRIVGSCRSADAGRIASGTLCDALSRDLRQIIGKYVNDNATIDGILDALAASLVEKLVRLVGETRQVYVASGFTSLSVDGAKLLASGTDVNNIAPIPSLNKDLNDLFSQEIKRKIIKSINSGKTVNYTTVEFSPVARDLYNRVYGSTNMTPQVAAFYEGNINRLEKSNVNADVDTYVSNPAGTGLRLNLKKADSNKDVTVFENAIPLVPSDMTVLLTTNAGVVPFVHYEGPYVLRHIYNQVYNAKGDVGMARKDDSVNTNLARYKKLDRFSIDHNKYMKYVVESDKLDSKKKAEVKEEIKSPLDGLQLDMATGDLFYRHDGPTPADNYFYKLGPDGKEIKIEKADISVKDLGLNTSGMSEVAKDDIFNCLLTGEGSKLNSCLKVLSNEKLFEKAEQDVSRASPEVLVLLLKKFGFHTVIEESSKYGRPIKIVEPYESWAIRQLPQHPPAIRNNSKLLTYLRSLVDAARKQPALFTKGFVHDVSSGKVNPKYNGLDIHMFNGPVADVKASASMLSDLLRNMPLQSAPAMPFVPNFGNVIFATNPFVGMRGGGNVDAYTLGVQSGMINGNASALRQMFNDIRSAMKSNGKDLDSDGLSRVNTAIRNIEKLEVQLVKLMRHLENFTGIQRVLVANSGSRSATLERVSLDSAVNTSLSAEACLADGTKTLKECISTNKNTQQRIIEDLVKKIYADMVAASAGLPTPNLSIV